MSEDLFRAAQKAPPGTPGSYWSYALYRGSSADGSSQKPKVHYCRSRHTAERVCQQYFMDEKVLGFDLEWIADSPKHAGPRRNVSLIQLASPSRIALFHVALFAKSERDEFAMPTFKKIMEDSAITKVGVWIKGDATRLRTNLDINSRGLMELSHLYKLVTFSKTGQFQAIDKRFISLAVQVEQYLHLPMFKGQDVRSSDWTKPLSMEQITYSASDAYAGVHLYATLEHHREKLDPCPPRPHHAELNKPIRLAEGLNLDTDSEEESSDGPPEEADLDISEGLTASARKRQLKAYLKSLRTDVRDIMKVVSETETPSDELALPSQDPRVKKAQGWAEAFISENQPSGPDARNSIEYVSASQLRAYHLWHTNKDLAPGDIAKLLRDPPLKTSTIVNYIWKVVQKQDLPVDQRRYIKEVIDVLPQGYQKAAKAALYHWK
ncbi:ribonuclease H-like domain-containing protein [Xylariales sp. PMI_506]|nr:ribonuclease H-like domain-containing protein [Xylariales sp. PMI_506]